MKSIQKYFSIITTLLLILPLIINAQEKKKFSSVQEALMASGQLRGSFGPRNVNWINGGERYSFTATNPETRKSEIRSFDPATFEDQLIFNTEGLTFPGTNDDFNYGSFQWASDSKHILFQTNFKPIFRRSGTADYYVYSLEDKDLTLAAEDARTAELSPDGSMTGYEKDGNMFVYSFENYEETQLTDDATKYVYNGHFDWMYEEEFGLAQAWKWSPDSKFIAYWQLDASGEPIFQMTDYEGQHPEWIEIPYPKVGDDIPPVKIGIVDVHSGENVWVNLPEEGEYYIPRIYWTNRENTLAVMYLNRAQTHMKLYFADAITGETEFIFEEISDAWIEVFDFSARVDDMLYMPAGIDEFFWVSDRDGYKHIYRFNYAGELLNRVTEGNFDVQKIHGINVDDETIYYESTEVSPLERHLYSVEFDGSDKEKITEAEGWHSFDLSPNTKYFFNRYSNTELPRQVELWSIEDGMLQKIEDNKSVNDYIETIYYSPEELHSFTTSDGVELDYSMIKPVDFDPSKKYPVVFTVYGGPNSQGVSNSFTSSGWSQYLAQKGYLVVNVNNRGSSGYGRDFKEIVYKQLGKWESNDFVETLDYLVSQGFADSNRAAIMGTSYGGFSTTYTMATHPGKFDVGIANSPGCTDWRLYDAIYTERYMGLLDDNLEGYENSRVMNHVDNFTGNLLLVHSALDENVHITNTMQLLTALTNAGKDAELRIYPPGAHGAAYNFSSYIVMLNVYYNFLDRYLNDGQDQVEINKP